MSVFYALLCSLCCLLLDDLSLSFDAALAMWHPLIGSSLLISDARYDEILDILTVQKTLSSKYKVLQNKYSYITIAGVQHLQREIDLNYKKKPSNMPNTDR